MDTYLPKEHITESECSKLGCDLNSACQFHFSRRSPLHYHFYYNFSKKQKNKKPQKNGKQKKWTILILEIFKCLNHQNMTTFGRFADVIVFFPLSFYLSHKKVWCCAWQPLQTQTRVDISNQSLYM